METIVTKKPQGVIDYENTIAQRKRLREEGRLWRVSHPMIGSELIEASKAEEAVAKFASVSNPAESRNKDWLTAFGQQCRVAKVTYVEPGKKLSDK